MSVIYDYLLDCFRINKKSAAGSGQSAPVQSVNSKTGAVVLDAADVGAMPANGMPVEVITSAAAVTIPAGGKLYTLNIEQDTTITFPTPGNTTCYFWLYLTTGATIYTVTLPTGIDWDNGSGPALNSASSIYRLAFLWDAPNQKWLGSLFWPAETLS